MFSAKSANTWLAVLVTEEFVQGAAWSHNVEEKADGVFYGYNWLPKSYTPSRIQVLQDSVETLEKMDAAECMTRYDASVYHSDLGDVLLVSALNRTDGVFGISAKQPAERSYLPPETFNGWYDTPIEYCLAQRTEEHCEIRLQLTLLGVVIACNTLKVACFIATLLVRDFAPLATVGDAIASFMTDPETLAEHKGPISAAEVHGKDTESWNAVFAQKTLLPWRNDRRRWATVATWREWMACVVW